MSSNDRADRLREGTVLYEAGHAREAARVLRAIRFGEDERDTQEYATWCCNLGAALAETREFASATALFEQASAIHAKREEWGALANVEFNLGNVSRYAGASDQAEKHYQAALAGFGRVGSQEDCLRILQALGNLQLARGDVAGARSRLDEIAATVKDEAALGAITRWALDTLRGKVAAAGDDAVAAVACFERALGWLADEPDRSYMAEAETTLGRTLAAAGRDAEAIVHLDAGFGLWTAVDHPRAAEVAALRDQVRARLGAAPAADTPPPPRLAPRDVAGILPLDAPPSGPEPAVMAARGIADEQVARIIELSRAHSGGGIVVRIGDEAVFAATDGLSGWRGIDAFAATVREFEDLVAAAPSAAFVLQQAARVASRQGVDARRAEQPEHALAASACALRLAAALRSTAGLEVTSTNLLVLESVLAARLRRTLGPQSRRDEVPRERCEAVLAGLRALGAELAPVLAALVEDAAALDDRPARLRALVAQRRLLAAGLQEDSLGQNLLPAWAGGGIVGARAGAPERRRRAILAEIVALAESLGRREEGLRAIYEELAHARLSELVQALGQSTAAPERLAPAGTPSSDTGAFDALWDLYRACRAWIEASGHGLVQSCAGAVDHFEKLRLLAVYGGTASGHVASYAASQFLTWLNRDLVSILQAAGAAVEALEHAERTAGRAMADWMARTHLSPRIVLREGFTGSAGEVAVASLDEIRQAAQDAGCLVAYYLSTPAGWRAWLVGPEGLLAEAGLEHVEPLAAALAVHLPYQAQAAAAGPDGEATRGAPLARQPQAGVDAALAALGDALFPPVLRAAMAAAGCTRLAVVTDGALHYVPFACLRPGGARYLVEDLELVHWPSATCRLLCDAELQEPTRGARLPSLVMGDPRLAGAVPVADGEGAATIAFGALPGTHDEAALAGRALGVAPHFGPAASWRTVLAHYGEGRRRPHVPVLHLAAHALLVAASPEDSFVALADGPLRARFLYGLDRGIRADLVVLSCCQTGLGGLHPDSVVGLANAFLVAGACAVMSTLWQVPDASTQALVQAFYAVAMAGETAAAALRQAQLAILSRPEWAHPLYWGAFKLSGANPRLAGAAA